MASYIMRMILNGVLIGTLELTMLVNSLPQVHTYFENQPIIPWVFLTEALSIHQGKANHTYQVPKEEGKN